MASELTTGLQNSHFGNRLVINGLPVGSSRQGRPRAWVTLVLGLLWFVAIGAQAAFSPCDLEVGGKGLDKCLSASRPVLKSLPLGGLEGQSSPPAVPSQAAVTQERLPSVPAGVAANAAALGPIASGFYVPAEGPVNQTRALESLPLLVLFAVLLGVLLTRTKRLNNK